MSRKPAGALLGAFLACGAAAAPAPATEIYKCVDDGGTAYQSIPCPAGASEIRFARGPLAGRILPPAPRAEAARYARKPGPWTHHVLTLGMSDDEVLNLPGWGRPARITRVRLPRMWREEWIYDSGLLAEQRLYFVNGKLAEVVALPPEARVVETAALPAE